MRRKKVMRHLDGARWHDLRGVLMRQAREDDRTILHLHVIGGWRCVAGDQQLFDLRGAGWDLHRRQRMGSRRQIGRGCLFMRGRSRA